MQNTNTFFCSGFDGHLEITNCILWNKSMSIVIFIYVVVNSKLVLHICVHVYVLVCVCVCCSLPREK